MNVTPSMFTIDSAHAISQEDIADILVTAFEGGCNYWIQSVTIDNPQHLSGSYYASDVIGVNGQLTLHMFEGHNEVLTLPKFLHGYTQWFTQARAKGVNINDIDADQADVILQYALFGKLIYG